MLELLETSYLLGIRGRSDEIPSSDSRVRNDVYGVMISKPIRGRVAYRARVVLCDSVISHAQRTGAWLGNRIGIRKCYIPLSRKNVHNIVK